MGDALHGQWTSPDSKKGKDIANQSQHGSRCLQWEAREHCFVRFQALRMSNNHVQQICNSLAGNQACDRTFIQIRQDTIARNLLFGALVRCDMLIVGHGRVNRDSRG